jgi:hypothetical protein
MIGLTPFPFLNLVGGLAVGAVGMELFEHHEERERDEAYDQGLDQGYNQG